MRPIIALFLVLFPLGFSGPAFAESPAIRSLYGQILEREPDADGWMSYTSLLQNGVPLYQIRTLMATSAESTANLQGIFDRVQQRAAANFEIEAYESALASYESLADVRAQIQSLAPYPQYALNQDKWRAYSVTGLRGLYGVDALGNQGAGQTIAILLSGYDSGIQVDLERFSSLAGLPTPNLQVFAVNVSPASQPNFEARIDTQAIHAIAPYARIIFVAFGAGSWSQAIAVAAQQGASVISMSFGMPEGAWGVDQVRAIDKQFALYPNITFVAASGDSGSNFGQAAFPASSPHVISVGANADYGNVNGARIVYAWEKSGGGVSAVFPKPDYQNKIPAAFGANRLLPDVAMVGAAETPVFILFNNRWIRAYGSSVAAPIFAGMMAIANGLAGAPLGSKALPPLYRLYDVNPLSPPGFILTLGGYNGYAAGPSYNLATGMGAINNNVINWLIHNY